jgi:hypothetical protein
MALELTASNRRTVWTIRAENVIDEQAKDATTAKLRDSGGAYGIRRLDTGASVVAAGTAIPRTGVGEYEYKFDPPVMGISYEAAVELTQANGDVDREALQWFARAPIGGDDPYLYEDEQLKVGIPWIDELIDVGAKQHSFAPQRLAARQELDSLILQRTPRCHYDAIREALERGELILTPEIERQQRLFVLADVLFAQQTGQKDCKYERMSKHYRTEADRLTNRLVARFDVNGDGFDDFCVDLSRIVAGLA